MELGFVLFGDEGLSAFDSENNVYVKLGVVSAMMPILGGLFTCRPSGALGCLVYAACYKHAAPLGLNAEANSLPRQR